MRKDITYGVSHTFIDKAKIFDKYCLIIIQWQRGMNKKREQLEKETNRKRKTSEEAQEEREDSLAPPSLYKRNLSNAVNCFSFSQVVGPRRWSGHKVEGHLDHRHMRILSVKFQGFL